MTKPSNTVTFIEEILTTDPDSGGEVAVSLFKDPVSGGIFGIDSSFIDKMYEEHEDSIQPAFYEPFNNNLVWLDFGD